MKWQHVKKPNLYSPVPETGPLALRTAPIRPVLPDAGFGNHWPFFPFAILFALLLLLATNRMQANASSLEKQRIKNAPDDSMLVAREHVQTISF